MTLGEALDLLAARGLLDRARCVVCGDVRIQLAAPAPKFAPITEDPEDQRPRCVECGVAVDAETIHPRVPGCCQACGSKLIRGQVS